MGDVVVLTVKGFKRLCSTDCELHAACTYKHVLQNFKYRCRMSDCESVIEISTIIITGRVNGCITAYIIINREFSGVSLVICVITLWPFDLMLAKKFMVQI